MDAVEKANAERQKKWCELIPKYSAQVVNHQLSRAKVQKIGEGTYAVVYRGSSSTTS
jgi:hypothetical protein